MVSVKVYVEGGGQGKLRSDCREGFSKFFEKSGLEGHMPSVIACGSRDDTLKRIRIASSGVNSEEISLLLVDSEAPVQPNRTTWQHLSSRDKWERPNNAQEKQAHLMVQCMESWFMADVSTLETFFGAGFISASLPKRDDIENIPKQDVFKQLISASRASKKGAYHKGRHSFDILAQINPAQVIQRSKFANRLVDTLKEHLIPT